MGNTFDAFEAEYGLEEDSDSDDLMDAVAQSFQDEVEQPSDLMLLARKKLAKAQYYELIVNNGIVEDNGSAQAREVNGEARSWAYSQMTKLLGVGEPEAAPVARQSDFTDNEVLALKKLAEKLLGMTKEEPKPAIKLAQAPAPSDPPKLRKIGATAPKVPTKAPPKAAPAIATPKTDKRPMVQEAMARRDQQVEANKPGAKKKPPKVKVNEEGEVNYDKIPSNMQFTDTDGFIYMFRDNPHFDPDKPGSKARAKTKISAQAQAGGINRLPFPDKHGMEAISMAQSSATVQASAGKGLKGGISANASMPGFNQVDE